MAGKDCLYEIRDNLKMEDSEFFSIGKFCTFPIRLDITRVNERPKFDLSVCRPLVNKKTEKTHKTKLKTTTKNTGMWEKNELKDGRE